MTDSELQGNILKWLNEFSSLASPSTDPEEKNRSLARFLSARISEVAFIENDEDVFDIRWDGRIQKARVLGETGAAVHLAFPGSNTEGYFSYEAVSSAAVHTGQLVKALNFVRDKS